MTDHPIHIDERGIARKILPYSMVKRQWTPSNMEIWGGSMEAGDRFSREQLYQLAARNLAADEVETLVVRRKATIRELWWGPNDNTPIFEFECPVLSRQRDARVKVISPSGVIKLVWPDGAITKRKAFKPASYAERQRNR
jgi:hypothetical protein